jgi:hypothetical protein
MSERQRKRRKDPRQAQADALTRHFSPFPTHLSMAADETAFPACKHARGFPPHLCSLDPSNGSARIRRLTPSLGLTRSSVSARLHSGCLQEQGGFVPPPSSFCRTACSRPPLRRAHSGRSAAGRPADPAQTRQSSQHPLDFFDFLQLRVTQIIVYYKKSKITALIS